MRDFLLNRVTTRENDASPISSDNLDDKRFINCNKQSNLQVSAINEQLFQITVFFIVWPV